MSEWTKEGLRRLAKDIERDAKLTPMRCQSCDGLLNDKRVNTRGFIGVERLECEDCRRLRVIMKRANRQRIGVQSASEDLKREIE